MNKVISSAMPYKVLFFVALLAAGNTTAQPWKKKNADTSAKEQKTPGKGFGAGLMNKLVTKVAKLGGEIMMKPELTADLNDVTPMVYHMTNLAPSALATVDMSFYNGWKEGGNATVIMFTRKNGAGTAKIDGEVTVDGQPADYVSTGVYVYFSDDNQTARKVEIATKENQRASFSLPTPAGTVLVKAVNGQTDNIVNLDLTKDVTIDLESKNVPDGTPLLVRLAGTAVGLKSMYDVGYFPSGKRIVIPSAAFRNINMEPGNKSFMNWKNSYLQVELPYIQKAEQVTGPFAGLEFGNMYHDGRFVKALAEPKVNTGLTVEGAIDPKNGKVTYDLFKPNAFRSRNFAQIRKIGVSSFAIRGTTSYYSQKDDRLEGTRTTKTASFPQFDNKVWDAILADLYQDVTGIIAGQFGATTLPVETITGSKAYAAVEPFAVEDQNTTVSFTRSYKNTKLLSAFVPISHGYGSNNTDQRILKETNADALLQVTLDLQINFEKSRAVMVPILGIQLIGAANGPNVSTKYFTATIKGEGVPWKENISYEVLRETIIRQSDLMEALRRGLKELVAAENANPD
ncbi:MAG: hypothetical protein EOP49_07520, partial [Sphingobacteriales bacterium]